MRGYRDEFRVGFQEWPAAHRIPESFNAFCKMVSLTAAKTNRILVVSVAWVRLQANKIIRSLFDMGRNDISENLLGI